MVFFDMGGTIDLYPDDPESALEAAGRMLRLLHRVGIRDFERTDARRFHALVRSGLERYRRWSGSSLEEIPTERFWREYVFAGCPIAASSLDRISEEMAFLIETGFHRRSVRPEAGEALEALGRMGIRTGIISNVLSRTQVSRNLEEYGLSGLLAPVVTSAGFGRRKPHPSIFLHACDLAGFPPDRCAHVGNSPSKDIRGALEAGYALAIQIHYEHNSPADEGPAPHAYIRDLRELPRILKK